MRRRRSGRYFAVILIIAVVCSLFAEKCVEAQAANEKLLTLDMAKKSGVLNSPAYEKLKSELEVKEVSLKQAVKSIKVKQKNMSTFRWSPLLSFKFPEKPDLSEAYEFEFKPVQIQAEIDTIRHKMTDQALQVYEDISTLYVEIVSLQDTLAFYEERQAVLEETLVRNRARLKTGQATQSDIDAMEQSLKMLNDKIASDTRNLEADKKKLSEATGMDVTTGYSFEDPFVETRIKRDSLDALIQYTLDRDERYYEVSLNAATNLVSLQTSYRLMEEQYGGKMSCISDYVNQVIAGQKVNGQAFRKQYEEFLKAVDEPWQGKVRILFIRIPREWFKGQISGIRYVEDEPYALYEAALEYQDALLEKQNEEKSLRQQVEQSFHNLVNVRNAYQSLVEQVDLAKEHLRAEAVLNRLGELTYEEYRSSLEDYEDTQNEMYQALAEYSQTLYSFDRLTCGGITALLEGTDAELNAGMDGESYVETEYAKGAYYYVEPIIEQQEFRLGVSIPSDFEVNVTHFELWCDQMQIGGRTETDRTIRHLSLSVDQVSEVKLRFYDGSEFVDDCVIDPEAFSGPLSIVKEYRVVEGEDLQIGTYTLQTSEATGMATIVLKPKESEAIGYYRIRNREGSYLVSDRLLPVETEFRHLALIQGSEEELTIEFFDADSQLLYTGYFDSRNMELIRNPEET